MELDRRSLSPSDGSRPLRLTDLILPLGIGAVLRLALVVAFIGTLGRGDEAAYLRLGWGWSEFGAYTGMWAPLYPKLISYFSGLFGDGAADALRIVQVFMAVWAGVWTALIADMFGGRRAGLIAAWMFALYLPLAGFAALMYSESLFLCFFLPSVYQLLRYAREGRIAAPAWRGPLAGCLLGLAALTRESTLIFVFPCMVWVAFALRGHETEKRVGNARFKAWAHGKGPLAIAPALLFGLTALLTVMPWTIRNAWHFDRFVPIATSSQGSSVVGWNAYDINYDIADLGDNVLDAPGTLRDKIRGPEPAPWSPRAVSNVADASELNISDGLDFAKANPGFFLRSRIVEFVDMMSPLSFILRSLRITDGIGEPLNSALVKTLFAVLAVLMVPAVVLLGLWGWTHARDAGPLRSLAATLTVCTVSVAAISGMTRYRVPVMPLFIVLGALYLAGQREKPPRHRKILLSTLTVLIILSWIPSIGPIQMALAVLWKS
ncbi:hypothetical protein Poly30_23310 [Planctomycetes bacterium Poly30]|uniref:Glycosyltransferase RgtA/B/C/D-like domain-containing protein n=1 Tax=Saltatorellus ferox TaxID=2528018 RepID=A0A518ERU9_9BACT|nr:hypothetical protein Poly30_23310 [Planctomycetes bacterium Poly30]